jgi:mannose-1-phosphate guanylyltransferase/mannose-6-phosphate isomerase
MGGSPIPTKIAPVIMSGGSGTRLWPLSTPEKPKQFHVLASDQTMLQDTCGRMVDEFGLVFLPPIVICSAAHLDEVKRQLDAAGVVPGAIVLEPCARNTAAVAAVAARLTAELYPDALALLSPADHVMRDPSAFRAAIARAAPVAIDRIVTFGIEPERPETGYGYIQRAEALSVGVYAVAQFTEKPSFELAHDYLAQGGYDWNAGIFLFSPQVMTAEMDRYCPAILQAADAALTAAIREANVIRLDPELFAQTPSESIDIAVMEPTDRAAVTPCSAGWADVGSWSELWRLMEGDARGNVLQGDVVVLDTWGSYVQGDGLTVAVVGLTDVIVVASQGAVVVLPKARSQDVKALVDGVKQRHAARGKAANPTSDAT